MKILYYFLDIQTMMYQWQRYHIVNELAEHNCEIEILSPTSFTSIEESNSAIIKKVSSGKYTLFMTCLTEKYLMKETILQIKKKGVPTLLFCPDNLVAPFNHRTVAPLFDLVWLTSKETEYLFRKWGCKTVFQPYAANPNFLIPEKAENEILRVGFVGTPHGSRIDRINQLLNKRIPVTIHTGASNLGDGSFFKASISDYAKSFYYFSKYPIGRRLAVAAVIDKCSKRKLNELSPFLQMDKPVPLPELAKVYGKYALVLSFTDANSTGVLKRPVKIVNLRNFEVPMSGAIQFTVYSEEMAQYFENDKEIIMGKTIAELTEKAKFYLADNKSSQREKIRVAARVRAENEHTWYRRFSVVLDKLSIHI